MTAVGNRQRRAQNGFTLLELLISIALLGLILVLLFGGLRLGVRSWDSVQQQVDNLNAVRSAESFLRHEMEQTFPYRWKKSLTKRMAFLGERDKVQFVSRLPDRVGVGGLYAVSLELEHRGDGRRLVWKHVAIHSEMEDFTELDQSKEVVLAGSDRSSVEDIWLTYFGRDAEGATPRWVDRWDGNAGLPMLIRIQVKLADGAEWPDFVVAPMLTEDTTK
jgi:general secretion pathway protein J